MVVVLVVVLVLLLEEVLAIRFLISDSISDHVGHCSRLKASGGRNSGAGFEGGAARGEDLMGSKGLGILGVGCVLLVVGEG